MLGGICGLGGLGGLVAGGEHVFYKTVTEIIIIDLRYVIICLQGQTVVMLDDGKDDLDEG